MGDQDSSLAVRELKNRLSEVLRGVEQGDHVTVTVDRRPVARLVPIDDKPTWTSGRQFVARFRDRLADPALLADLDELVPDTTDDL